VAARRIIQPGAEKGPPVGDPRLTKNTSQTNSAKLQRKSLEEKLIVRKSDANI